MREITMDSPASDLWRDRREELEAALLFSGWPPGRASQIRRVNGLEDYLFIGGDRLSAAAAAARLGVTGRTIHRYRAALRALTRGNSTDLNVREFSRCSRSAGDIAPGIRIEVTG